MDVYMRRLSYLVALNLMVPMATYANNWSAEVVTQGLNIPWGMTYMGKDQVMVSEKSGQIGVLDLSTNEYKHIGEQKSANVYGQGGLLDVAKSPFEPDRYYFTYSKQSGSNIDTTLASAAYKNGSLGDWQELLVTQSGSDGGRHFGSRITFDDQYLYFSVGDRGERSNGQNLKTHSGSILRVMPDGSPAPTNPFTNQADAQPEIWSFGHRNPQGLHYDAASQKLWSIEHGPRGGDEINLIEKGNNYGWPMTSHGKEYWGPISVGEGQEKEGITSPSKVYIPSIAPGSLVLYRGEKHPELKGKLLAGALKLAHLNVLTIEGDRIVAEERILEDLGERIRDIEPLPNGDILFSTDSGKIFRLMSNN